MVGRRLSGLCRCGAGESDEEKEVRIYGSIYQSNDLPTVSDKSLFASDRVRVIEFNRHFTEAEQDKNLKNEFQTQEAKTARIEIINPACYGDRIVPFNFEKTLVHELLHLKFSFWCQNEDDVGDRVMHQMIDDLARALTEGDSDDEA